MINQWKDNNNFVWNEMPLNKIRKTVGRKSEPWCSELC